MPKLFTYGTLMTGQRNNRLIQGGKKLGSASLTGFDMHAVDGGYPFPAIVSGDGEIVGEVWEIEPEVVASLDRLEGYREGRDDSLYLRKNVNVSGFGECIIYVFNQDPKGMKRIKSGNWIKFREKALAD